MPKEKKNPFIKATNYSLHRFKTFKSEDKTNLTHMNRTASEYADRLKIKEPLGKLIIDLSAKAGKKISILDAGCGACVAMDELLKDSELDGSIHRVTGVSMHYFKNAQLVTKSHPGRFVFYLGKVQDVLLKGFERFDLILDTWGAYSYSTNKFDLLKQYYESLHPGGIAHIYMGHIALSISVGGRNVPFFEWAIKNYPDIFSYTSPDCKSAVTITKSTLRFPFMSATTLSSRERASISRREYTLFQLKHGNALAVGEVINKPLETQLRLLPCI